MCLWQCLTYVASLCNTHTHMHTHTQHIIMQSRMTWSLLHDHDVLRMDYLWWYDMEVQGIGCETTPLEHDDAMLM